MSVSPSISSNDMLSSKLKTAVIYSPNDLFAYIVEIIHGTERYYISTHGAPSKFGNLEGAREAALKEKAEIAYLAVSNTYDETDLTTCYNEREPYSYNEVPLHSGARNETGGGK